MSSVQTKAPGKLYVAGEYAVVEPGHSAIVTAVDLFVYVTISNASTNHGSIYSEGFTGEAVKWTRQENNVQLDEENKQLDYVLSAIQTTEQYLHENGVVLSDHDIHIKSELDNVSGYKYGLGSSGAVTVAIVQGLLKFYKFPFADLLVYKLSVLSQLRLGINSSFGDLAAITYSGWIHYTSFDRAFVQNFSKENSISETVEAYWPKLMIKKLRVPKNVHFLVGWTGTPASSNDLVGAVQDKKAQTTKQYERFLEESQASVALLALGLVENNIAKIRDAVTRNRQALVRMGKETNVLIETPLLTTLCDIALKHGGVGKTSGAGGGDSGIAFVFKKEQVTKVVADWKTAGITLLDIHVHKK